jgi:membrane protease YdiL (CAAX protease family)
VFELMLALWQRLPVIVRAVLAGIAIAAAGVYPWTLAVRANQKFLPVVPWAIVPTAAFLWLLWRWLRGDGWPRGTSAARRMNLRGTAPSPDAFGMAIFAGILGFVALMPGVAVLGRLVSLPSEAQPIHTPANMPAITVFVLLVMASVVAGVVEEAAFRGYLQSPIERRHGPVAAIVIAGLVFGALHYTHHPASVLAMLPFYLAISAVYGAMAYFTGSIIPGLVLHAGGDVLSLTRLWITGKPEWQLTSATPKLIRDSGPDAAFWASLALFLVLTAAAVGAFSALAATTREERASPLRPQPY